MNNIVRWEKYSPVGIGLEDMFKRLDAFADTTSSNYPPYNIVKLDDNKQQLQIALAGWSRDEIEVAIERNVLNVNTNQIHVEDDEYIHKGIASRSFSRNWQLSEDTKVGEVKYLNGMLFITLCKEIPDEHKRQVLQVAE